MPLTEVDPGFLKLVRWAHYKLQQARSEVICTEIDMTEALDALVTRGVLTNSLKNGETVRGLNVDQDQDTWRARMRNITEPEVIALCAFISSAGARAGILPPWTVPEEYLQRWRAQ
jgi:hypothetical protein